LEWQIFEPLFGVVRVNLRQDNLIKLRCVPISVIVQINRTFNDVTDSKVPLNKGDARPQTA